MKLQILSLEGIKYEGEVEKVTLPSKDGEITILNHHIPLISLLKKGTIKTPENNFEIEGGFVEVKNKEVVVLVN